MTDFRELLRRLSEGRVRYVVIGGLALSLRGGSRITNDIDVCYARDPENLELLASALAPLGPTLRGAPPELPFLWDARTLRSGLNFTLATDLGWIDLLGEVPGLGAWSEVDRHAQTLDVFGFPVRVLDLQGLQLSKRAAGRVKDLVDLGEIAELLKKTSPR